MPYTNLKRNVFNSDLKRLTSEQARIYFKRELIRRVAVFGRENLKRVMTTKITIEYKEKTNMPAPARPSFKQKVRGV